MKIAEKLKEKSKKIKTQLLTVYYAYKNPEIKLLPKIIIGIAIAYALSPIDIIPDFIPVIGYLDDLIIIPALLSIAIKMIPKEIMEESRERAENESIKLKHNWAFAVIFILIWIYLIVIITKILLKFINR